MYNDYNMFPDSQLGSFGQQGHDPALYKGFIPRVSVNDQVVLGRDALGHKVYLDTGLYDYL